MHLLALTVLAAMSLPTTTQISHQLPNMGGATVSNVPLRGTQFGLTTGLWIDPSTSKTGRMGGGLYDASGATLYTVDAIVYEAIAGGLGGQTERFGGIVGSLHGVKGVQINVTGTWRLDEDEQRGTFETTIYTFGPSQFAPLLTLGSIKGRLGSPAATEPVGYPGHGVIEAEGSILIGGPRTERAYHGRWEMPG